MRNAETITPKTFPPGFVRVKSGPILAADLLYSWTSDEWIRADSDAWLCKPDFDAADAVCVMREPRAGLEAYGRPRTYTIKRPEPVQDPGPPADLIENGRLF